MMDHGQVAEERAPGETRKRTRRKATAMPITEEAATVAARARGISRARAGRSVGEEAAKFTRVSRPPSSVTAS